MAGRSGCRGVIHGCSGRANVAGRTWQGGYARRDVLRGCNGGAAVACTLPVIFFGFPAVGTMTRTAVAGRSGCACFSVQDACLFFCAAYRPCPGAAVAAESHTVACFSRDRHDAIHVRTSPHRAPPFSCRASLRQLVPMARSAAVKTLLRKKKRKTRFCDARRGSLRPPAWQKSLSVPEARPFIMTFLDAFRMTRAAAPYA